MMSVWAGSPNKVGEHYVGAHGGVPKLVVWTRATRIPL